MEGDGRGGETRFLEVVVPRVHDEECRGVSMRVFFLIHNENEIHLFIVAALFSIFNCHLKWSTRDKYMYIHLNLTNE